MALFSLLLVERGWGTFYINVLTITYFRNVIRYLSTRRLTGNSVTLWRKGVGVRVSSIVFMRLKLGCTVRVRDSRKVMWGNRFGSSVPVDLRSSVPSGVYVQSEDPSVGPLFVPPT